MEALPTSDLDQLWAQLMSEFSGVRQEVPITKAQLRALLGLIDGELETAEISIVQALPGGPAKTWLLNHQPVGRLLIERVERKRKEVL